MDPETEVIAFILHAQGTSNGRAFFNISNPFGKGNPNKKPNGKIIIIVIIERKKIFLYLLLLKIEVLQLQEHILLMLLKDQQNIFYCWKQKNICKIKIELYLQK